MGLRAGTARPGGQDRQELVQVVRVRRGILETPVRTYARPGEGRVVTLIGTSHIGEEAYYDRIRSLAASLEADGAVIQYEGVTATEEELTAAAGGDLAAVDAVIEYAADDDQLDALLFYLGWVSQGEMQYEPSWRNVDIDIGRLVEAVDADTFTAVQVAAEEETMGIPRQRLGPVRAAALAARFRRGVIEWDVTAADGAMGRFLAVIADERNNLALSQVPQGRGAALLWGAAHLPGLTAVLEDRGFIEIKEEWIRVGRMPGTLKGTAILLREALLSLARRATAHR
jgi:hypothetical protein